MNNRYVSIIRIAADRLLEDVARVSYVLMLKSSIMWLAQPSMSVLGPGCVKTPVSATHERVFNKFLNREPS